MTAAKTSNKNDREASVAERYSAAAQAQERTLCCPVQYRQEYLDAVPQEILDRDYGCGDPTPYVREGETVLDLGSGGGIDCFLASKEVGADGRVIGVDMTPDMLERARKAAKAGGYDNVEFRLGEIEALPVPDNSVDAVISNCVLNLSPARDRVFSEVVRVLKPGGRIMISDLISVHPTPQFLLENTDALVGCLPVQEDQYLGELRASGLEDVEIVEEKAYPNDLLTADPAVRDYLAAHPAQEEIILDFIGSIRSGMIQGVKPTA